MGAASVYLGDAFDKLGYDAVDRTLMLYQGALARDPDQPGRAAADWEDRVDGVFDSHEFKDVLAPAICAPQNPAYGAAMPKTPIAPPPAGAGFTGDQAALQAQLNATPPRRDRRARPARARQRSTARCESPPG